MNMRKCGIALISILASQGAAAEDLLTIYQQALQSDPQLKIAETKVEVGTAQKGQAFGLMLPQVNASANWSKNESKTQQSAPQSKRRYPGTRYNISLTQTLIDFAKYWEWRRASKIEDQYEAEAMDARNLLIYNVVDRYFNGLEMEDQLNFVRSERDAVQRQLEQVRKQYTKQLIKLTDVYAVEARLDQVAADEILAESKLVTAKEALREITGVIPSSLDRLQDSVEYKEIQGDIQQWIDVAQSQNSALYAKQIAIQAAENSLAVQKSKHLPVVDLQLTYYDTDTGYQSISLSNKVQTSVAAINVNVPIFSGGTTTHQMFEAQHNLQISRDDNEAAVRAIIKETSESLTTTNADARRVRAAKKAVDSASKAREAMEKGFRYGTVTIGDVLKEQQNEFLAKKELAQAKYSYIKNRIRFLRAIGSLAEENVQEVNSWLNKG